MFKNKLFKADLILILATVFALIYLYSNHKISFYNATFILLFYICSKIIAYMILPYAKFEIFLNHLVNTSKLSYFSGFEIFKGILIALLYFGFIAIEPSFWIIESILVVSMRIWGKSFIKNQSI